MCEVFKVELDKIRKVQPFDLDYWNIRDPPAGTDEREGKKWRRLYQYDIVSLLSFFIIVTSGTGVILLVLTPARTALGREEDPKAPHQYSRTS